MAVALTKDLHAGTQLFTPAQDARRARARRGVHVTGLDGNRGDLQQANAAVIASSDFGPYHPDLTSLPLQGVRSSHYGADQTRSEAVYYFDRYSNPTQAPFDFADETYAGEHRAGTPKKVTEDSAGALTVATITAGEYSTCDDDTLRSVFVDYEDEPIVQIAVNAGQLATNPRNTLADLYGSFNADAVCLNGVECAAGTLKFIHARVHSLDVNGSIYYHTTLIFEYVAGGWGRWRTPIKIVKCASGDYLATWTVTQSTPSNTETFVGAFPIFNSGSGPSACGT